MKANYRFVFNRKKKLNGQGKAVVQIEVYIDRLRKYVSTGIYLTPEQWNDKKSEVSSKHPNYILLNKKLRDTVASLEDYELTLSLNEQKEFTRDDVDVFFSGGKSRVSLIEFIQQEIDKDQSATMLTKKQHRTTLVKLKAFNPGLKFSELSYNTISAFDNFLRNEKKSIKFDDFSRNEKISINTVASHHKNLKKFINLAIRNGILPMDKNPYLVFRPSREASTRQGLTPEELKLIETADLSANPFMSKIRDIFLFSCYTGLRFTDAVTLKQDSIHSAPEGLVLRIERMMKVAKPITLHLGLLFDGKPETLLKKYLANNEEFVFGKPFTNQYVNRELKFLAQHLGIRKKLTHHIARHTFGTNLAYLTKDPYLIKQLMGHAKIDTSMIYIHNSEDRLKNQLQQVDWKNI
jgi:site-specific recombinase XerD